MKAELLLLMIISAMLMAATKIYAYEGATHDAIAPMKDTTGKILWGLSKDAGMIRINANVSGPPGSHGIHIHN